MTRVASALLWVVVSRGALAAGYDPLQVSTAPVATLSLEVRDAARDRAVPLKLYLPEAQQPAPLVLFSHGLGGTREGSAYLGEHWARRGYVAVFLQHPGSDDSVWKDLPKAERLAAMKQAASLQNFMARAKDVPAVLDQLEAWSRDLEHPLHRRLDFSRVAMSGHSFGAVTTQAVSGQSFPFGIGTSLTDPRIKAAVVMSPSLPRRGGAREAFGAVRVPWMLMTGTHDEALIGGATAESRQQVYPALPQEGFHFELVLDKAEHSAFTDRALPNDTLPRNPNHHRLILASSTAFLDATLRGDAAARAWLQGDAVSRLLESRDLFLRNPGH